MKLVCYDPHARRDDLAGSLKAFPEVHYERPGTMEAFAASLADAEILVIGNRAYDEAAAQTVLKHGTKLRWIQFTTSGIDKAIKFGLPVGVVVTNAAGLRAFSVAEHALALMLALVRRFRSTEQGQRDEVWCRDAVTPSMDNLAGKHLLIIGTGAIGQEIARKAGAFDMPVTGISRTTQALPHFDTVRPRAELPGAVAGADMIVMAANYEADTHEMFSRALIDAMKPTSYLVNIARGPLIDEAALVEALRDKRIAGAGLDVTVTEPLPAGHPLYSLPNVIVTPHIAGAGSSGTGAGMGKILADNLSLWLKGEPLQKIVIERTV
ncbi:MAG: D-isomer specific 2-hydroxyacid dehydrogenase NAD-binding protein [Hyphomicrobiales bacterium]|nr:D-isomer specific 2-hydroxyacid dehydrogenase NAD-binding protein [Hyphomicrobiales bacterium]